MPQVREALWFRKITSALRVNRLLNKVSVIRLEQLRSFFICCRPNPENPVPRSIMGRLIFYNIKFREILYIYTLLYGRYKNVANKADPEG